MERCLKAWNVDYNNDKILLILLSWQKLKVWKITSVDEDMKKWELLCTASVNIILNNNLTGYLAFY